MAMISFRSLIERNNKLRIELKNFTAFFEVKEISIYKGEKFALSNSVKQRSAIVKTSRKKSITIK